ncbi:MAG: tetratricopeptide repeat protein [Saprospiraceae bacterium]
MRNLWVFCLGLLFFSPSSIAFGQTGLDTLGLTGTIADTAIAKRLFVEMGGYVKSRKLKEADELGKVILSIYTQTLGADSKEVANTWHQIGIIQFFQTNYNAAIDIWETTLRIRLKVFGNEHPDVAWSYNNLGAAYNKKGDFEKSIAFHQNALNMRIKLLGKDHLDIAASYNNLGINYKDLGKFDQAIVYYEQSLAIRIKVLGPAHIDVADSYNNLGTSYFNKGEYDKCGAYHLKALEIRKAKLGATHPSVADSYNNLAINYSIKGANDQALECFQNSLNIRLKYWKPDHPELADSYNNIGTVYFYNGDFEKALRFQQKSLDIRIKSLGPDNRRLMLSYSSFGLLYRHLGDYQKSIDYFKKGIDVLLKTLGPDHVDLSASYTNIAGAYYDLGDYQTAELYYQKALDLLLKAFNPDHADVGALYDNIATVYNAKGKYDKAIATSKKALEIQGKTFGAVHPKMALTHYNLGNCYRAKGEDEAAFSAYAKAIQASGFSKNNLEQINAVEILLSALQSSSEIMAARYAVSGDQTLLNKWNDLVRQALMVLEYQQRSFQGEGSKSFYQNKHFGVYEQAIKMSLTQFKLKPAEILLQNAFTFAEKSKATLLQAQIKSANASNFAGIPDSLLQRERDLRVDITWLEKQRQALFDRGIAETDTNVLQIGSAIFDLKLDYEALIHRFESDYRKYYRLKYDLSTVSLQEIQHQLLNKNQALLEYFVGDSSVYLFVVRRDTVIVREVRRDFPLEDWVAQYRQGLYGYHTIEKSAQTKALYEKCLAQYMEYAQKLYNKLVAPVQKDLLEQVILAPDGLLNYVPFDALLTAAPKDPNNFKKFPYLCNKHQFSYTYSATLLKDMRNKEHYQKPEQPFLAFAPFYRGNTAVLDTMFKYDDLMRKDLHPLDFSGPEVAAASTIMGGEMVVGGDATKARFMQMASNYRMLHLATHGHADNRLGVYAFLAFAETNDSIDHGLLYVKDLYNMELNADLVVLSACETGIGKLQRGEGVISLARAFAYAGAKSIVTTLWEVNDQNTSRLIQYFYRELQLGNAKDKAWSLARKRYIKEQSVGACHPFYWAAFVPIGDMRAIK